jgi:hypothetical protein
MKVELNHDGVLNIGNVFYMLLRLQMSCDAWVSFTIALYSRHKCVRYALVCRRENWLNSGTVIIGTTVLFVAHKYGFLYTFKHWDRNPPYNI